MQEPPRAAKSKAADQRAGLGPPEVSTQSAIMAPAQNLCAQPATGGDAEAISLTLSAAVQEPAPHQERPAFRCANKIRVCDGLSEPVDELTERRCHTAQDGPEDSIDD